MDSWKAALSLCLVLSLMGIGGLLYSRSSLSSETHDLRQQTTSLTQQLKEKDEALASIRNQLGETRGQLSADQAAHRSRERQLNDQVAALQDNVKRLQQALDDRQVLLQDEDEAPDVKATPGHVLEFADVASRFEATALAAEWLPTPTEIDCGMVDNAYNFSLIKASMMTRDGQKVITGDVATKYRDKLEFKDALSRAEQQEVDQYERQLAGLKPQHAAAQAKLDNLPRIKRRIYKNGRDTGQWDWDSGRDAERARVKSDIEGFKKEIELLDKAKGKILANGRKRLQGCRHHITIFVPDDVTLEDAPKKICVAVTRTQCAAPEVLPELHIEANYLGEW